MTDLGSASTAERLFLPCLAVKVEDAAVVTGTTRSRIYEAIRERQLTARKAGRSTVILVDELGAWLKSLPSIGKTPTRGGVP
jgi:excisionase family DNA binding protein